MFDSNLFLIFILALVVAVLIIAKHSKSRETKRRIAECTDFLEEVLSPFDREKFIAAMTKKGNEIEPWMFNDATLKHRAWQKHMMESIRLAMKELRLLLEAKADSEPWKTRLEAFQVKIDVINNS